jgi:hypothetical protein
MNISSIYKWALLILSPVSLIFGDSILVGTGLPGPTDVLTPSCSPCGQIYVGPTGYVLDDRQRLAQAFSFPSPVHVNEVVVGISASYLFNSHVFVLLTDAITTNSTESPNLQYYLAIYPTFSNQPQTIGFGVSLDLLPSTVYYIVLGDLGGQGADGESNPGPSAINGSPGVLGNSYYANSGLGQNLYQANWTAVSFPTVSFELVGTPTPEPAFGAILGLFLVLGFVKWRHERSQPERDALTPIHSRGAS